MTDVTDYDAFYDQLMSNVDELLQVARDKFATEKLLASGGIEVPFSFPGSVPLGYGNEDAVDFEGSRDAVATLASDYLNGDHGQLEEMALLLQGAMVAINGPADGSASDDLGIDPMIGDIHGGLGTWDSEAGELFTANFVDTLGSRKTRQFGAIEYAWRGVETGKEVLVEARTRALRLPLDAKTALEDYNPWSWLWWSGAKLMLTGIGLVSGPAKGLLVVIGDSQLGNPDPAGSVAGLLTKFTNCVNQFGTDLRGIEAEVATKLDEESTRLEQEWSAHVCSKPVYVKPTPPGDEYQMT